MSAKLMRVGQAAGVVTLVGITTYLAWARLQYPTTGIDDANIFLVYASNVSAGEGFVFNHGGERVEGFTSLLWVLICSAVVRFGRDPERSLLVLNVLLVALTTHACLRSSVLRTTGSEGSPSPAWAGTFLILLLADFRYVVWTTITLMETALWGALLTAAAIRLVDEPRTGRYDWTFALLMALLVVTRPEALVWAPLFCVLLYFRHSEHESWRDALQSTAPSVLAFMITTVFLTLFRLTYFGFPLPSTYYAKLSPSLTFRIGQGLEYAGGYIWSGPIIAACTLALILSVLHLVHVRLRDYRTAALTLAGTTGLMLPVLTGGDHFEGFRFYQPAFPIVLLAMLNCLRFVLPRYVAVSMSPHVWRTLRLAGSALVLAALVTFQIADWIQFDTGPLETEFALASKGRQKGEDASALFENGDLPDIGTIAVGGFRYTYRGEVVDLMGLNNLRMAHNGGDRMSVRSHAAFEKHTFYELHPTVVLPLVQYSDNLESARQRVVFVDRALKNILLDEAFHAKYRLAEVRARTSKGPVTLAAWYDVEFLDRLKRSAGFEIVESAPGRTE